MKLQGFIILFLFFQPLLASQDNSRIKQFDRLFERAQNFDNVSLFIEAVGEIDEAINMAEEQGWVEKAIEAKIYLAELKRKTGDIDEGYELLKALEIPIDYPQLQVHKINRLVALALEGGVRNINLEESRKIIMAYLSEGIELASRLNLRSDLGDLYNQLGYYLRYDEKDTSLKYLNMASSIFWELGDTANYIVAQTNAMRVYVHQNDSAMVLTIFNELNPLFEAKRWFHIQMNLYELLIAFYDNNKQIKIRDEWQLKLYDIQFEFYGQSNTSLLFSYRTLYETDKYQDEANEKAAQLERESKRRRELLFYVTILLILSLGVGVLLFRERRLKAAVNKANDRYHMLLVESNHRIKNNLQMIISMLEYASRGLKNKDSTAFKNMSGKIQTISALHKHLYLDVHNERVALDSYFNDIIGLYKDMSSKEYKINRSVSECLIQSERIVYFGLVLNEMLSNTFEHGNAEDQEIELRIDVHGDHFLFTYQDYSQFEYKDANGTGIQLIKQLVDRVEGQNFNVDGKVGKYQFEFYA